MKAHWNKPALCNYRGEVFTNADIAALIARFGILYDDLGIKKGDKIALCAKNTARWGALFFSITAHEAVCVSILADFHPDSVNYLVDHSDSVLLFTDKEIWDKLDTSKFPKLKMAINVDDFALLYSKDEESKAAYENLNDKYAAKYPAGVSTNDVKFAVDNLDELAVINYTSGTTSAPKGVMLTYGNLSASIQFGHDNVAVHPEDKLVSMLPMAHIYGMVFEFLYPVTGGAAIYFLGKSPAPSLLLKAMKDVQPYLVCTVPLVMEKIYKSSLKPVLSKWYMKILTAIPGINQIIYSKVRGKLDAAFGGKVTQYIMGGAALNPEVEKCFKDIKLHYTIGYGMTEAAPLLAYEDWHDFVPKSCGKAINFVTVRIDSEDPYKKVGEIQAKGVSLMSGYYKNEEATTAAFTEDGWMKTGDLGLLDKDGNIFIKGRSKNMILSANGQNIYPEEIEAVVNNQPYVVESVVVNRGARLVALVYLDAARAKEEGTDIELHKSIIMTEVNKSMPAYSKLNLVEYVDEPFEKTPKMSIKRFMYK